ncbi:MAG TPA: hypothetical protein DD643_04785 [Synechococcus sp. UBA8638]|nr:hypothetical protein [Synechococcus sp. UBA8638]
MARFRLLMLLILPVSLLNAPAARGDTSSSAPGITREDQREERFYNFDQGRQSGGGFTDPSDLIQELQKARNLQYATEPEDAIDAGLEDFTWPEEEQGADSVADSGIGSFQIPDDLFPQVTPSPTQEPTPVSEQGDADSTSPPSPTP